MDGLPYTTLMFTTGQGYSYTWDGTKVVYCACMCMSDLLSTCHVAGRKMKYFMCMYGETLVLGLAKAAMTTVGATPLSMFHVIAFTSRNQKVVYSGLFSYICC